MSLTPVANQKTLWMIPRSKSVTVARTEVPRPQAIMTCSQSHRSLVVSRRDEVRIC